MSTNSASWERFGGPALTRGDYPVLSSPEPRVEIALKRVGPLDQAVSIARRLRREGVRLSAAQTAMNELAAIGRTFYEIASWTDSSVLAADLAKTNVAVLRPADTVELASRLAEIRVSGDRSAP